jgi:hypothetical protein
MSLSSILIHFGFRKSHFQRRKRIITEITRWITKATLILRSASYWVGRAAKIHDPAFHQDIIAASENTNYITSCFIFAVISYIHFSLCRRNVSKLYLFHYSIKASTSKCMSHRQRSPLPISFKHRWKKTTLQLLQFKAEPPRKNVGVLFINIYSSHIHNFFRNESAYKSISKFNTALESMNKNLRWN